MSDLPLINRPENIEVDESDYWGIKNKTLNGPPANINKPGYDESFSAITPHLVKHGGEYEGGNVMYDFKSGQLGTGIVDALFVAVVIINLFYLYVGWDTAWWFKVASVGAILLYGFMEVRWFMTPVGLSLVSRMV